MSNVNYEVESEQIRLTVEETVKGGYFSAEAAVKEIIERLVKLEKDARCKEILIPYCQKVIGGWSSAFCLPDYFLSKYEVSTGRSNYYLSGSTIVDVRRKYFTVEDFFLAPLFTAITLHISPKKVTDEIEWGYVPIAGDDNWEQLTIPQNNHLKTLKVEIHKDGNVDKLIDFLSLNRLNELYALQLFLWSDIGEEPMNKLIIAIANNPSLKGLKRLVLQDFKISEKDLIELASSSYLTSLEYLEIGGGEREVYNDFTVLGIQALASSRILQKIQILNFSWTNLNDEMLKVMALTPYLKQLKCLALDCTRITAEGIPALCQIAQMSNLDELTLNSTPLAEDGVEMLENAAAMKAVYVNH